MKHSENSGKATGTAGVGSEQAWIVSVRKVREGHKSWTEQIQLD